MIVAVVLSAGESRRMGRPKALLPMAGATFIEGIFSALKASKVGKIIVVLGHNADEIRAKIDRLAVNVIVNRDYAKGQLSSLIAALRSLDEKNIDGALVHLVDHPFLSASLVDQMIDRFYASKKSIVVPTHHGKRGHPVLFSSRLFPELLSAPLDQGAKAVVQAHRDETLEIETDDEGVTLDIDTPEDYRRHVEAGNVKA
jgi:molybdenum cofactor cytidylyltransferase